MAGRIIPAASVMRLRPLFRAAACLLGCFPITTSHIMVPAATILLLTRWIFLSLAGIRALIHPCLMAGAAQPPAHGPDKAQTGTYDARAKLGIKKRDTFHTLTILTRV
jgi:hypothetical protein